MFHSDREKTISKAIVIVGSFYIIFLTLMQRIIQVYLPVLPVEIQTLLIVAFAGITIIILVLGKEKIFSFLFKSSLILDDKKRNLLGAWNILIEYEGPEKEIKRRTGVFNLKSTASGGYVFEGDKLLDMHTEKPVANSWSSRFAEFLTINEQDFFIYVYCIDRSGNDDCREEYDKIGIVVAKRENNKEKIKFFKGIFKDIELGDRAINEVIKSGRVTIMKSTG